MNALIPTTNVGNIAGFGSLLVALFSVSAVLYALLSGGSVA